MKFKCEKIAPRIKDIDELLLPGDVAGENHLKRLLGLWNDLLVAIVFLGAGDEELVLTGRLVNLLGMRGGQWDILAASAFITIIIPLIVFFALQRYLVRGLLAGSVKGG